MPSRSLLRWALVGVAACSLVVGVAAGCNIEADTKFGNHSGLLKENLPTPPAAGDGGGEGGVLCNGNGPIDGGACAVSWKTDIWPKMSSSGVWSCANNKCHGATANDPSSLDGQDHAYAILTKWTTTGGKPYINPCTTDPDASSYLCNMNGSCGTRMPYPDNTIGSGPATPGDLATLTTWIACGSPNN